MPISILKWSSVVFLGSVDINPTDATVNMRFENIYYSGVIEVNSSACAATTVNCGKTEANEGNYGSMVGKMTNWGTNAGSIFRVQGYDNLGFLSTSTDTGGPNEDKLEIYNGGSANIKTTTYGATSDWTNATLRNGGGANVWSDNIWQDEDADSSTPPTLK